MQKPSQNDFLSIQKPLKRVGLQHTLDPSCRGNKLSLIKSSQICLTPTSHLKLKGLAILNKTHDMISNTISVFSKSILRMTKVPLFRRMHVPYFFSKQCSKSMVSIWLTLSLYGYTFSKGKDHIHTLNTMTKNIHA